MVPTPSEQQIFECLREFVRKYGIRGYAPGDLTNYCWEPDSGEANYVEVLVSPDTPLVEITVRYSTQHDGRAITINNPVVYIDATGEVYRFHGDFYRVNWETELGL